MNDEELLKIATRAWKVNFGNLSEGAQNLLKRKKILVHDKELAGLNRGTANIIKANGGVQKNINLAEMSKEIKDLPLLGAYRNKLSPEGFKDFMKGNIENLQTSSGHLALPGSKNRIVSSGDYIPGAVGANADTFDKVNTIHSIIGRPIQTKSDMYTKAILDRHEADELRYAMHARKTKGHHMYLDGIKAELTGTPQGHLSHKVILNESSHVALAPKGTRRDMTTMRNNLSYEPDAIRELQNTSFEYGKSAVPDRRLGNRLNRAQVKANTEAIKANMTTDDNVRFT